MNTENRSGVSERLATIRQRVLGDRPPPREIEVFIPEDSAASGARTAERLPIRITAAYPIRSHRRILGRPIVFAKCAVRRALKWFIEPVIDQINPLLNAFQNYFESHEQRLHIQREQNLAQERRVEALNQDIGEATQRLEDVNRAMETAAEGHRRLSELFEHLAEDVAILAEEPRTEVGRLQDRIAQLEGVRISERLNRLERLANPRDASPPAAKPVQGEAVDEGRAAGRAGRVDYYVFHERFRGDEQLVRKRQERYAPLFKGRGRILDIGCGRGEFLALLNDSGIESYGIDLNADMIAVCRGKGLEVAREEALAHLDSLAPDSLGGVFCAQVIEHLDVAELTELIARVFERLGEGGLFVAETLNPASLAFLKFFYQDPSHVRPYPAETLSVLLESAGFANARTAFTSAVPPEAKLGMLPIEPGFHRLLEKQYQRENRNIEILNDRLFGPTEYAIIAEKPPAG